MTFDWCVQIYDLNLPIRQYYKYVIDDKLQGLLNDFHAYIIHIFYLSMKNRWVVHVSL